MQQVDTKTQSIDSEDSIRNIAILLSALPERTHRTLLGQLSSEDKHRILDELDCLDGVDSAEQHQVLSVMREQLQAETQVVEKVESEIRDEIVIGRARLSKKPETAHRRVEPNIEPRTIPRNRPPADEPDDAEPFGFVHSFGVENVARVLQRETPETIAWVLTAVDSLTGSLLLEHLDDSKRSAALSFCATAVDLDPKVLTMVANHVRSQLESLPVSDAQLTSETFRQFERRSALVGSGNEHTRKSLKVVRPPVGRRTERLPSGGTEADRQAESVDRVLIALAPRDLCRALGMVTTEQAFLVLCGLPNATAEKALDLLPRRMARRVRTDMRRIGQLHLADIDAAKLVVAEVALRLTVAPQKMVA
ncbi:MAG: FliG C-terminal domain-containing protein [Planctomycetota bacterium]